MDKDTYMVMKGNSIVGYVHAYSSYHALNMAEKFYGNNLILQRIPRPCSS